MQDLLGEWREWLRGEGAIPVIPAVDVLGAGAVRPRRGAYDEAAVRAGDPVAEAVAPALLQASGGIRGPDDARALLEAGADRVVVGTAAFPDPGAFAGLGERVVVALDVRDREVRTAGWTASSGLAVEEAAGRCALAGVVRVLVTAIDRDGTLAGPDLELVRLVAATGLRVLAAGGIRSPEDVAALAAAGAEAAVVGRALLATGR